MYGYVYLIIVLRMQHSEIIINRQANMKLA